MNAILVVNAVQNTTVLQGCRVPVAIKFIFPEAQFLTALSSVVYGGADLRSELV